jgi:hypothetical protein
VLISGTAYDHLQGKLDLPLDDAGKLKVKNISRSIRAYSVRLDGVKRRPLAATHMPRLVWVGAVALALLLLAAVPLWFRLTPAANAKLSMMVLPFDNMSGDKEQEYLADGISEDLTTELARIPGLIVIPFGVSISAHRPTAHESLAIRSCDF